MLTRLTSQRFVCVCVCSSCVKLKENATETYVKLKLAYAEHFLWRAQVFRWHKVFLDGRETVEDEPRSGRPCTAKTDEHVTKMRAVMRSDRRLTERSAVCWIWITKASTTFWPRNWAFGKFVQSRFQKNLTNEQMENWRNVCLGLLERIENEILDLLKACGQRCCSLPSLVLLSYLATHVGILCAVTGENQTFETTVHLNGRRLLFRLSLCYSQWSLSEPR